jgi:hypothetical protein
MLDPEKMADGLRRLYTPSPGKARQGQETWWPLGGAALGFFLLDLILRQWRSFGGQPTGRDPSLQQTP